MNSITAKQEAFNGELLMAAEGVACHQEMQNRLTGLLEDETDRDVEYSRGNTNQLPISVFMAHDNLVGVIKRTLESEKAFLLTAVVNLASLVNREEDDE